MEKWKYRRRFDVRNHGEAISTHRLATFIHIGWRDCPISGTSKLACWVYRGCVYPSPTIDTVKNRRWVTRSAVCNGERATGGSSPVASLVGIGSGSSKLSLVGARGFEPPTPASRTQCATGLRY